MRNTIAHLLITHISIMGLSCSGMRIDFRRGKNKVVFIKISRNTFGKFNYCIYLSGLIKTYTDMKTTVTSHGTVVEIHYKNKIYYCLLVVDFDMYKTYGNQNIDTNYLVFWDGDYQLIPYVNPLYEVLSEIVKKKVIDEKE